LVVCCWLLAAGLASGAVITQHYQFSEPILTEQDGAYEILMPGTWNYGDPGEPILPLAGVRLLLPPGEVITDIEVIPGECITLDGSYLIAAGQQQYPLSHDGPYAPDLPSPAIYESRAAFPGKLHDEAVVGLFRGYRIASFAMHPIEYLPVEGTITWMTECEVRITTHSDAGALAETTARIRHDAATVSRLAGLIDNPAASLDYRNIQRPTPDGRDLDPALAYSYLIITTDAWSNYLTDLVDFQTQRGHKCGLFTREWIDLNYSGSEQERIRNFIIDAYSTWPVDYALLVGDANDANGIPHRGLYAVAYGTTDSDIPADLYYGCLDGNWNTDGDGYWGEPGEEDYYHEVGIGRVCISNTTELQNFLTKNYRYQLEPVLGDCNHGIMVGELLWSEPTWGGDYKDEILFGASTHGYTTVGFPLSMNISTLYDRNGTWSASTLINIMNNGMNIINHLGHCNTDYMMKFYIPDIGQFTNDGVNHINNFVYSQGCYPGAFDSNCIGEQLQCVPYGPVAFVINSRYGWGMHESTNGSSQYFDRQFFDALFGEDIYPLADMNDDSKMDNVWSINYGANRWCYYELNLFGDPAMHLWTATPGNLDVTLPGVVFIGEPDMEVTVYAAGGGPLNRALVTIYTDDYTIYDTAVTDASGLATLHPDALGPGTLNVTVTAHDRLDFNGDVPILPPEGPYLVFESSTVLDPTGDSDGVLDEGEDAGLEVTLENVGVDGTTGVSAVLSTEDTYVTIVTDTAAFPDIPAGGSGTGIAPFEVEIAGDTPDGHHAQFTVSATALEGSWDAGFSLLVEAPVLTTTGELFVHDSPGGDGSGTADAGETFDLWLGVQNGGHSDAEDLTATLTCGDANVVIHDGSVPCENMGVGGSCLTDEFVVEILPSCPEPCTVDFELTISSANGYEAVLAVALPVGGWFDDMETDMGWTIGAAGDNASSGIWTRVDPNGTTYNGSVVQTEDDHTPEPGTLCFVTGQGSPGGTAGENDVDGGKTTLLTPVFNLDGSTTANLTYWRWYTNDLGNNPGEDWWNVEVTDDGVTWVSLEHTQASLNAWTEMNFDLSMYIAMTDQVQLRFVAEDVSPGALVEAAVDDFLLTTFRPVTGVDDGQTLLPARLSLYGAYPNPFNPKTTVSFDLPRATEIELCIYDISGRHVATLAGGEFSAGRHELTWLGRDDSGHKVASGIYFSHLNANGEVLTRKMVLIK